MNAASNIIYVFFMYYGIIIYQVKLFWRVQNSCQYEKLFPCFTASENCDGIAPCTFKFVKGNNNKKENKNKRLNNLIVTIITNMHVWYILYVKGGW